MYRQKHMTTTEIAREVGLSAERVRQILTIAGIRDRHRGAPARDQATLDAHERIWSREARTYEEADRLGLTIDGLYSRFKRLNLRLPGREPAEHGTRSRYVRGCHCDKCRKAQREYMTDYRRRKGNSDAK